MNQATAALVAVGDMEEEEAPGQDLTLGPLDDIRTQKRDDCTLRVALEQATNPGPSGEVRFVFHQEVLYQEGVDSHTGQQVDRLVVPQVL